MLEDNELASNMFLLILVAPPRPPQLARQNSNQDIMALRETSRKTLEDIPRKGLRHPFLVSLRDKSHLLMIPVCLHFPERGDRNKRG